MFSNPYLTLYLTLNSKSTDTEGIEEIEGLGNICTMFLVGMSARQIGTIFILNLQ